MLVTLNEEGKLDLSSHPKIQERMQFMTFSTALFTCSATLEAFQARFSTEEACADYLFASKWPKGFCCSRCSHTVSFRISTRRLPLLQCGQCHYQASPIVDTIMESSSTDLRKWFTALFIVASTESSIHALRLSKLIHVTYKTAWAMLHKIRLAITQADEAVKLAGPVSLDVARCGKLYTHTVYSELNEFPVLIGKKATRLDRPDYVKLQLVSRYHYNDTNILPTAIDFFKENHIVPGTHVTSSTFGMGIRTNKMIVDPIVKHARAWIIRTFSGLGRQHLQHYLNEFAWRLNTRLRKKPFFESLLKLCATTSATSYAALIR